MRRGPITKQGSRLVRWAAVEAISGNHGGDKIKADSAPAGAHIEAGDHRVDAW